MKNQKEIEKINNCIARLVYDKSILKKAYNYYHCVRDSEQFKHIEENFGVGVPTSVEFIDVSAFSSAENLKEVNFEGTVEQWSNIQVSDYNEPLLQNGVNCTDGKVTQ